MKKNILKKEDIKKKIRLNLDDLKMKYPVNHFYLFGSYARDEQTEDSDIDIMVDLKKTIGFTFVHLALDLEALLKKKVDLVSIDGIEEKKMRYIREDMIDV
jgi:predicted nucleotidyltransferase